MRSDGTDGKNTTRRMPEGTSDRQMIRAARKIDRVV
jgi:hypothetical protein